MSHQYSVGISEFVLIVADVHISARFYCDVVGLTAESMPENGWAWFWAGAPSISQRIALRQGSLLFEEHSPHPADKRWGHVHFALNIPRDKFDEACENVRHHHVTLYGPVRIEWMKANSVYFYDPDGNLIEFWSPDL